MSLVFLDRDGVIARFPGKGLYTTRVEDFRFAPNALEAIRRLTEKGFELVVVSNQGCVSRGLITEESLWLMTEKMLSEVRQAGGRIRAVYYCPHQQADNCDCKKPQTKLFLKAIGERKMDLGRVYVVGDSEEDIGAARNLGCRGILVLSGRTRKEDLETFPVKPDVVKNDLLEAASWIIEKETS